LEIEEPTSCQEAIDSSNHKELMDATMDQMDSMVRNKIWELVDHPSEHKSNGNKWVFKTKHWTDESISEFKARLVAQGFAQIKGVDYEETFSLVVRIGFIRLLPA